jgi:hypothetical protein
VDLLIRHILQPKIIWLNLIFSYNKDKTIL